MNENLRKKLRDGETAYGLWVTLENPAVIEIAVATGLDWVCIDLEHGYLSYPQVANLLRAADRTDLSVLVRVPSHDLEPTKRVLDLGAHGVVVPLVGTPETLTRIRDWAYYPPQGVRGLGGERNVQWGLALQEYVDVANNDIMVLPVIETREGIENIDAILDVPGTEALIIGPGDLSSSYGHLGQWEGPGIPEVIDDVLARAKKRGIACGILGRSTEDIKARAGQGFGMVGLGSDLGMVIRQLLEVRSELGLKHLEHRWF